MKITHRLHFLTPGVVAVLVLLGVILVGTAIASTAFAATESNKVEELADNQHLITVHDDGVERAFLTTANTLGAAFKDAGFLVGPNDLVEPGLDEELVAANYQVNVYRARPVVVRDGDTMVRVLSPYQTARQIAKDAGMDVRAEDEFVLTSRPHSGSYQAAMHLTVTRAKLVNFTIYGKRETVYTQANTVGELVGEKDITLGAKDSLSKDQSTPIRDGMKLELWRNGKQTITREEVIKFDVRQIQDADREVGYKKVKTEGAKGKRTVTYEVVMEDGKEVSRKKIQVVVIKKPITQVEVVGAKVTFPSGTCGEWMKAAGITHPVAIELIGRESGCNPCSHYPSSSNCNYTGNNACGIPQALPCSKLRDDAGCGMTNAVCQLRWMQNYVYSRHGSWEGAKAHHDSYGWY